MGRNRRRRADSRKEKPSVLLVVQGAVTEKEYFQKLKQTYRIQNLTIRTEPHSPERLVDKVQQYVHQEKEPFTYVFFVVDLDETSKSQFEQAFSHARKTCSRKPSTRSWSQIFVLKLGSSPTMKTFGAESFLVKHSLLSLLPMVRFKRLT